MDIWLFPRLGCCGYCCFEYVCNFLCAQVLSFLSRIRLEVRLWGCVVILCQFQELPNCFPPTVSESSDFFTGLPALLFSF